MQNKTISVVIAGSGTIKDIAITPGVTVKSVLEEAGLQDGYVLSRKGGDALANDADIYNLVSDKEKLYASPEDVSVGSSSAPPLGGSPKPPVKLIRTRKLSPEIISMPIAVTGAREFKPLKVLKSGKDIPYWQESSWIKTSNTYRGSYKTDYGSWRGLIDRNYENDYSFFIFNPPQELKESDHWQCFSDKGSNKFLIHFSEKPQNVDSGIITVESLIRDAFRKTKQSNGGPEWKPSFLELIFPQLRQRK